MEKEKWLPVNLGYQNGLFTERLKNMELNHKKNINLTVNRFFLFLFIVEVTVLTGCSVKYSFTGAHTQGLKTFNVVYFQNRAPIVQPGLSQTLTDALIDKCKAQTNMKYVTGIGDAGFEGEIKDYNTRPLTVAADAQAATNRFSITVQVKFTNSLDPTLNFDQPFTRYEDYNSNLDLSAVEADLSNKILDMLVEDIFNQAFVNW
jgi:hypothetical protein